MESTFSVIALITAGIALAMALVNLFTGLHKDGDKVDLIFGIMCVSLFIHFIWPPTGFILIDKAPYPESIIIKRIFNFLYACLFPWFVVLYTGYKNKIIPVLISAFCGVAYLLMAFETNDSNEPIWVSVILIPLGMSVVHGFFAVKYQVKSGQKTKASWLFSALAIFAVFYVLTVINQFGNNYFGRFLHTKIFFPINIHPLAFMLIMGVRLRANSYEKLKLEKLLRLRDTQWHSILEDIQLVVLELDTCGRVKYINPFGRHLLGHSSAGELLTKNWFDNYLSADEAEATRSVFMNAMKLEMPVPYFKNKIQTLSNQQIELSWANVMVYDDLGKIRGCLSIGADITNEENAYREIFQLRNELEKENINLKGEDLTVPEYRGMIGKSTVFTYAIQKAKQVATANAAVLLEGETGVGKEVFADLIHYLSLRKMMPLVKVNCGALPAELIEDELFGHEKGAFTGALQARKGRFEMADGGTIFLDEIGELPLALQPKLLRVLQNGEFERIGGQQTIKVDVRVISATNRNLEDEVQNGRFREDLFYRLNVFPITIPPLRRRKEDILLLISFFIEQKAKKYNKEIEHISKADINRLCNYSWPGNIRELKNVIERSVISANGDTLKLDWWEHEEKENKMKQNGTSLSLEQVEKEHILKLLIESNWKINGESGAAQKLAMHPNTLRSKMKKLSIYRSSKNEHLTN
jgi:PAS domain S-box-containing protein